MGDDIHLVNPETAKNKDCCRKIVSTSVRDLASHSSDVAYSNFRSTPEKWNVLKYLPKGSVLLLKMMKNITEAHSCPIFPAYLLNKDCSICYCFAGTARDDRANNG